MASSDWNSRNNSAGTVLPPGPPTLISEDLKITGSLETDGEVDLNGRIEGSIAAKKVTIGSRANFQGEIVSEQVVVAGKLKGKVTARKIKLQAGSEIEGDLIYQSLAIDEGAEFEGSILRKKEDSAWTNITKTFETPGVELTTDAAGAVDKLSGELANDGTKV
ncbi:MAG: polymer-forming cytoskeletal protein [Pseudomonadota bacterium]